MKVKRLSDQVEEVVSQHGTMLSHSKVRICLEEEVFELMESCIGGILAPPSKQNLHFFVSIPT
jgi:hypothetical protein